MNNIENIISHIKDEANQNIDKIRTDAEREAKKIKDDWSDRAKTEVDAIKKKEAQIIKSISDKSITSIEIMKQKEKLGFKNDLIKGIIDEAKEKIINLPINEYVDMLKKLYTKNVPTKDCVVRFNKKDLERLPKDFFDGLTSDVKNCKVSVAKEPANIEGGFILDFGDIIWNMSIDSLIDQNIESITDKTHKILFG